MKIEAADQYSRALKEGQRYYKSAVSRGAYPYPLVLDELLHESAVAGYADLGITSIPTDQIIGTKSAGRTAALAGNFMPLLEPNTEFAAKWMSLCDAHLSDEGIRDAIEVWEYLGRFYIQEGNKRLSVLLSYGAPTVAAHVTRVIPSYSEDPEVQIYYEFMRFYTLSRLYGVEFRHRGCYEKLQAALGFAPDHVWTDAERRSFSAGFSQFRTALGKHLLQMNTLTPAEVLLVWLQVFRFRDIKDLPLSELTKRIDKLWPDVLAQAGQEDTLTLSTEPEAKEKSVLSKLLSITHPEHLNIAMLYAWSPEEDIWTQAHDEGRKYLEDHLGTRVTVRDYLASARDYDSLIESAVSDGAEVIFATDASMISACRKAAALHKDVKILNCGLFQPYTGVRMYNGRTYECKFVTGAIAGAMANTDVIGYVANSPVFGTPASVNAFALGARLTNPNVRIQLDWACLPGDPVQRLSDQGVRVISNREILSESAMQKYFELGTFRFRDDGSLESLVTPFWSWGKLYEKIVLSIFSGAWNDISASRAINYWWGMGSGVLDVRFSETLPEGLRQLGEILKSGIQNGSVSPFQGKISDQNGVLRSSGRRWLKPEEILSMNWFCDNVDGEIPGFDALRPEYAETVRLLGLYREQLLPEAQGGQL